MKAITKLKKLLPKGPAPKTAPAKALLASNYIRQYGDKGYVPSNGIGVGGSKGGEMKPSVVKKMVPKKKQYTPSNAGYSHFA
jgi:hypothetical protein